MPEFHTAYLETHGDDSIIADPPFFSATDYDSASNTNANVSTLIYQNYGFCIETQEDC